MSRIHLRIVLSSCLEAFSRLFNLMVPYNLLCANRESIRVLCFFLCFIPGLYGYAIWPPIPSVYC